MPTHAERRIVPYAPQAIFDLVADVERYPAFLPWCRSCKITGRHADGFTATLIIGHRLINERFTSRVTLTAPNKIDVAYLDGPMRYLSNKWVLNPTESGGTEIDFFVDFEFKNPLFQKMMGVFFNEIVKRMVGAFETRARQLYG